MKIKMIINPGEIWFLNSDYEISLYFNELSLFIRRENISHRIPSSLSSFFLKIVPLVSINTRAIFPLFHFTIVTPE